jgi:tRNA(Ile)-lysidine synthase TilS/MesJ
MRSESQYPYAPAQLALCGEHFIEWIPEQIQRFIEKYQMFSQQAYPGGGLGRERFAFPVDILCRLGYQADGLYISLGIDGGINYSAESQRLSEAFAAERGLRLHVVNMQQEHGASIPEIAERTHRGQGRPCSVCGLSKRHIMNRVARQEGYHVLATGHNLDDEAAVLFGNTLNWLSGYLVRQGPVLEANRPGVVRKVKPLCRIYEREMAAYALLRGIEYIYEECPHAAGAKSIYYKEMLNRWKPIAQGQLSFYLTFLQAKENGLFAPQADPDIELLHSCPSCGQATSAPGECAFCRLMQQV